MLQAGAQCYVPFTFKIQIAANYDTGRKKILDTVRIHIITTI